MYNCCFCAKIFLALNSTINHIKIAHKIENNIFQCKQGYCNQTFNSLKRFKKHLKSNHTNNTSHDTSNDSIDCHTIPPDTSPVQNLSANFIFPSGIESESVPGSPGHTFDIGKLKEEIENNLIKFVLSLHNINHFNRKDILTIQELVKEYCLDPLGNLLHKITLCHDDHSKITQFVGFFNQTLDLLNTEHKFCTTLKNRMYITNQSVTVSITK